MDRDRRQSIGLGKAAKRFYRVDSQSDLSRFEPFLDVIAEPSFSKILVDSWKGAAQNHNNLVGNKNEDHIVLFWQQTDHAVIFL